jgi:hypothetical protein
MDVLINDNNLPKGIICAKDFITKKWCSSCTEYKDKSEFNKNKQKNDGLSYTCRECKKVECKDWYSKNKVYQSKYMREKSLKRLYNITLDGFDELRIKHNNKCAICGTEPGKPRAGKQKKFLEVDHDHKTGAIRGLLCSKCNTAIGLLEDEVDLLKKAIKYLNEAKIK